LFFDWLRTSLALGRLHVDWVNHLLT
jgi:hypothetical protein